MDTTRKWKQSDRTVLTKMLSLSASLSFVAALQWTSPAAFASTDSDTSASATADGAKASCNALRYTANDTTGTTSGEKRQAAETTGTKNMPEVAMVAGEVSTAAVEAQATQDGGEEAASPVFIDNDQIVETKPTYEYEALETNETGTKARIGATFPVVFLSELNSKSAKEGDSFEARLKYDLKIGDKLIAEKGCPVVGHINYSLKARCGIGALVSPERWYKNSGCIGLTFDEVVTAKGEHIPLVAVPARKAVIIRNKADGRELGVNSDGEITGPWGQQLKYKVIKFGISTAMMPAGAVSFGAAPVVMGVLGAANPSFAMMKPVGDNVRHRRLKGFFWGAVSGLPGGWVVEELAIRGQESVIKPGDEFLVAFKEEFSGEPATASQMQGTAAKVRGEVVPVKKRWRRAPAPVAPHEQT